MPANTTGILPTIVSVAKGYRPLNAEGLELANLAAWSMERIGNTGMLAAPPEGVSSQPLGSVPNPAATQRRVWLDEPPGSVPFDEQDSISAPTTAGADVAVLTVIVPQGYDGIIRWVSNNVAGSTAFTSGTFIWKININGRPVRNFGRIVQEKGTIYQGREISPIRVFSGDTITYTVQLAVGFTVTGTLEIICSLTGYYYPSKGVS
jgi:hypothetical protein